MCWLSCPSFLCCPSSSVLPPPYPPFRPTTPLSSLPSLPRNYLFPVLDSLFEQPLPSSEPELYSYLNHTKATQPSTRPHSLAWLHSQPRISTLTSTRTYRFLLQYAFEDSNLRLVQSLLEEMRDRGVARDKQVLRVLLRGYLRHGKEDEAKAVARDLGDKNAVLLPTKPVVLGSAARGRKQEQFDVLWKGWDVRGREIRAREAALRWQLEETHSRGSRRVRWKTQRARGALFKTTAAPISLDPSRRLVVIPRNPSSLVGSDITTLVDLVIQEARIREGFDLAKAWLKANRPSLPSTSTPPSSFSLPPPLHSLSQLPTSPLAASDTDLSSFGHKVAQYNSTALALLNLLLRSLCLECPSRHTITSFLTSFLARHSPPSPARPLVPNIVTLRTLICALRGVPNAWKLATETVDWFGYRWGLPETGKPHSHRVYFTPPSDVERTRLRLKKQEVSNRRLGVQFLHPGPPHRKVPADIAILLLLHAVESRSSGALPSSNQVEEIRSWWDGLGEKHPSKDETWTGWRARRVIKRAKEEGLFKSGNEERRERSRGLKEMKEAFRRRSERGKRRRGNRTTSPRNSSRALRREKEHSRIDDDKRETHSGFVWRGKRVKMEKRRKRRRKERRNALRWFARYVYCP